ncbi:hypothetical protein T4B_8855 [Trichinella pseudospiralis]|uniref:Uncharacterized protein n=1 Tax=Trichinella pseudospiralis TaxID=6337 RepID=A0A0V1KB23_TRIPS|nr:hypothetical protein T4A_13118 [Trichinella pseudospiralis]KRZ20921.1 hypothetical protein T4B_8855 [Trichinella pseudospiralis]KRZ44366.1 hypothetical protein T4C_2410 [Trichinella pseudospiralis]
MKSIKKIVRFVKERQFNINLLIREDTNSKMLRFALIEDIYLFYELKCGLTFDTLIPLNNSIGNNNDNNNNNEVFR